MTDEIDERPPLKRPKKNGRPWKYPWLRMEVGDTFRLPDTKIGTVMSAAAQFVRRHDNGWKFKGETQPDGSVIVERVR